MIRREFVFEGRVQHVGFRYTARLLAKSLELTGWVRNEYDGRVTMVVQGKEQNIDAMLFELLADRFIRIDHYDIKIQEIVEGERGFTVRY